MASTSTQRSSSSSSSSTIDSHSQWSWDVFLSFRGKDTRGSFTDHLYSALIRCNIRTFRDDEGLRKGEEISPELLQAIEESRIAVIVFSQNYADSKWCLEELVKIMSCKEERDQKVIPIFYHVDPTEVRNQREIYKEAFTRHEENADEEKKEKIRRWKTALREAGKLAGYDVKVAHSYEAKIIDDIIKEIRGIIPMVLDVNENIVGMNSRLERLISGLEMHSNDVVRMVGVCGFGGIGKTTIITALYNKISSQFRSISFLTNVREESTKDSGILQLQQQLLHDTLGVKGQLSLNNIRGGVKVIKDQLSSKRVLIFLDDIDNLRQLEHLVGQHAWFGPGSRIVITTRRKDLLISHGVDYMYEVDLLNDDEALQLFYCYAFKQHLPKKDYRDLCIHVVRYAAGLPLALKVLGSLLRERSPAYWKSELRKLKNMPNTDIVTVLKLSYDGLDDQQKSIFLDIACYFKGNDLQRVTRILDGSKFNAESGINALVDRCLITISRNMIEMHDLLIQMGREIVDKECLEPGERSRLWRPKDVYRVFEINTGTEKIEGIFLHDYTSKEIEFTSEAFKRMTRLRWLIVFNDHVQLHEDFAFPSYDLTYLFWDGYSLSSLPLNFRANNLVELNLYNSNIKRLWEGNMCLENLRRVDLSDSEQLIEVPEFSTVPKLENLVLSGCVSLESLPGDIHKSKRLLHIRCNGCSKLASFPEIKRNIEKLEYLRLDETAIKELPPSIKLLKGLQCLSLNNCKNLESLPDSICNLINLQVLTLDGCSKLGKLPEDLERLPRLDVLSLNLLSCRLPSLSGLSLLRRLRLDECNVTPEVIKSDNCLKALKELSLRTCKLNEGALNPIFHLSSLEILNMSKCWPGEGGNLSDIVVGISQFSNLRALYLSHCKKLSQIPELPSSLRLLDAQHSIGTSLPSMHSLMKCLESANQDLKYKRSSNEVFFSDSHYIGHGISIVVPGSGGIPKWIRNQSEVPQIRIQLPHNWYENDEFLGIAICYVYVPLDGSKGIPKNHSPHSSEIESDDGSAHESENEFGEESTGKLDEVESPLISTDLVCQLTIDDGYGSSQFVQDLSFRTNCLCYRYGDVSEQMWMTLYPKIAILERCNSHQLITVIQASFLYSYNDFKVLKCGLQPMYAYDSRIQTKDVDDDPSCLECQRNVEYRKLCLRGQTIQQLPNDCAVILDTLCLRDCQNLESLPTSIWDQFNSLKSLFCSNCSQLQHLPEILQTMENMRELHLNGTAIKELPSSVAHLSRLQVLNLADCQNLETLPESLGNLCFLQVLNVSSCSKLHRLPHNLGMLQSLKILFAHGLNSMCCHSLSLSGLCSLKSLLLAKSMLMQGVILSHICCLSSLEVLDLCHCNIDEGGIPSEMWQLSSLKQLLLRGNGFRTIPIGISQLSMLRLLDLSHCPRLLQIPELPSSLRILDVHGCGLLETSLGLLWSSLFKCFESLIQDLESGVHAGQKRFSVGVSVIISGSWGIPNWISHQKIGAEVVAKLPQDWYKSRDLLGFVLYCIYDPLDINESEAAEEIEETYFKYDLSFLGDKHQSVDDLLIYSQVNCNDDVPKMWMVYYPKVAIKKQYHSNKWRQLKASFCGNFCGKALKVRECGIHLIYSHDHDLGQVMIPTICRECQKDEESQLKLCANGDANNILLTTEYSLQSDSLCFRGCKNLRSLPSRISEVKSLKTLFFSGCSQLRSFPEILEDMKILEQLHLDGTAIEELPSSIQHLQGLVLLNLNCCNNLVRLPESICNLKSLKVLACSGCSNLRVFPEISENMEKLEFLNLSETSIEELPSSIEHLHQLQFLYLKNCSNLLNIPESLCKLSSLEVLYLDFCTRLEKFPRNLESLQHLAALGVKGLNLSKDCLSGIPADIKKLSNLRAIDLSHCQNLLRVPDLPPTLRNLDVHNCTCLDILSSLSTLLCLSMLSCFFFINVEYFSGTFEQKYCNRAITVQIPGNNGIPEWISQGNKGSQITIDLPMDWHINPGFFGFAIYSVFIPMACGKLNCKLSFCGDGSDCWHVDDIGLDCCRICGESNQMCVVYYNKVAIVRHYWPNKWRRLKVSFHSFDGEPVEVKECGFHLIYIPEDTGSTDGRHESWDNTEGTSHSHQLMIEYNIDEQTSCDDIRSAAAEDASSDTAQTSYHHTQFPNQHSDDPPMDTTTQNVKNSEGVEDKDQLMIEYNNDEQISCDTISAAAAAEDDSTHAQTSHQNHLLMIEESNDEQISCDDTRSAAAEDASDPLMDTTTQNVNNNVVDTTQDDEEDRRHNWLELLCNFVQWICSCRR